jgi:hypothetical protein
MRGGACKHAGNMGNTYFLQHSKKNISEILCRLENEVKIDLKDTTQ